MFSKILFLVILCCAAVITNADPEPQQSLRVRRAASDKVKAYFKKLDQKIHHLLDKVSNAWLTFWDRVTGRESQRQQHQINKLKHELQELQWQSSAELAAEKAKWHAKLEEQEEELGRLRKDKEAIAAARRKLEQLQKEAATAIEGVLHEWDQKANNLGSRIERTLSE